MRLGTSSPLAHASADEWAKNQVALGCSAVVFPLSCNDPEEKITEYKNAAEKYGLMFAEVGIWRNAMSLDPDDRKRNIDYCVNQLRLADFLNARCAVNVAGVKEYIESVGKELRFVMSVTGFSKVSEIDESVLYEL